MSIADLVISASTVGHLPSSLVPPLNFKPIKGNIVKAWESVRPPSFNAEGKQSAAKKAGLMYERKAKVALERVFRGKDTRDGQWLGFTDSSGARACQPDFLVVFPTFVVIVEIKVNHCELAWWQLRRLYSPVVERVFGWPTVLVEVVKHYDPMAFWPEEDKVDVKFELEGLRADVMLRDCSRVLVVQWGGK